MQAERIYWREILVALRRIIRATDLQSKRMVKQCGLTIPQIMVMNAIEALGDVTVRRLADEISLSQATVTTILDRLEEQGLVMRVRSRTDRRIVNARLTATGRKVLKKAPPLLHEKFIERLDELDANDKDRVLDALQQVASMMDADSIDAAPLLDIPPPSQQ